MQDALGADAEKISGGLSANLSEAAARQEHEQLSEEIRRHDEAYYQRQEPLIPDGEYDSLRQRLLAIEESWPALASPDSPSGTVGAPPMRGFATVEHRRPLLSLENAFDEGDMQAFVERARRFLSLPADMPIPLRGEVKIDGVSLALRYEKGRLAEAATRGDGRVGEDVTANARSIADIPDHLAPEAPEVLEVRGEVYMTRADFQQLNRQVEAESRARRERLEADHARRTAAAKGDTEMLDKLHLRHERALRRETAAAPGRLYRNPRNAASGALRQKDARVTAERSLRFVAYGWGETSESLGQTQTEATARIAACGIPTVAEAVAGCDWAAGVDWHRGLLPRRAERAFGIDGTVFKIERLDWQARLGAVQRAPRWAVALKFPPEEAVTELLAIEVQVGRTGALTPVARVQPVFVGGVEVANVTLHNEDFIRGVDSSGQAVREGDPPDIRPGDRVRICRAGDVIPRVIAVDLATRPPGAEPYRFPERCPACGAAALRPEGEAVRRCVNALGCPHQAVEALRHFVSRDALDIEGLGNRQIQAFWDTGWVREPADIFRLRERHGDGAGKGSDSAGEILEDLEGWGPRSAANLFAAIEARRAVPLRRAIVALGIRFVGEATAVRLAQQYGSWQRFREAMEAAADPESEAARQLLALEGVGAAAAGSLTAFFGEPASRRKLDRLEAAGFAPADEKAPEEEAGSPLAGKRIVFTGTLSAMSRAEAKAAAAARGARVLGAVSGNVDVLVAGAAAGSKRTKAEQLGIDILDEEAWMRLISGNRRDGQDRRSG